MNILCRFIPAHFILNLRNAIGIESVVQRTFLIEIYWDEDVGDLKCSFEDYSVEMHQFEESLLLFTLFEQTSWAGDEKRAVSWARSNLLRSQTQPKMLPWWNCFLFSIDWFRVLKPSMKSAEVQTSVLFTVTGTESGICAWVLALFEICFLLEASIVPKKENFP